MRISDWSADVCSSDRVRVQSYASSVASSDGRNEGVKVWAYYNHGLPGGSIVFDLRGISSENSQMDVFRVLLQFASAMKDRHFDRVYLAWKGERRFFLEGSYFNERTEGERLGKGWVSK